MTRVNIYDGNTGSFLSYGTAEFSDEQILLSHKREIAAELVAIEQRVVGLEEPSTIWFATPRSSERTPEGFLTQLGIEEAVSA